jgi:hypothetical protein
MEERVSEFLDIDTRRALGLSPRRLKTIPDIQFPTKRSAAFGPISIKNSPFRLSSYFTVYVVVEDVYYIAETEYMYHSGRTVTRLTGGPTHHRLYQIPDEPETIITKELWKVHETFERLRLEGS